VTSLVGKALLGKAIGEKVQIKVPAGILNYEIMEIN
jgi:transcription elongation factor GreA